MERPIIFNDVMSRAILSGAKTETRRPVKPSPDMTARHPRLADCPFGVPGDTLWVREAWCAFTQGPPGFEDHAEYVRSPDPDRHGRLDYFYRASRADRVDEHPWRPSIHMPRCASRTVLDVLEVRVERLQSMSEEDAHAEGFHDRLDFAKAWESIYGTWRANPWVWVVRFKRQGGA